MRGVRENRRHVGPSPNLPAMWRDVVLRQFAESPRQQARARDRPSRHRIGATGRALVVLLSRRSVCRILGDRRVRCRSLAAEPAEQRRIAAHRRLQKPAIEL